MLAVAVADVVVDVAVDVAVVAVVVGVIVCGAAHVGIVGLVSTDVT